MTTALAQATSPTAAAAGSTVTFTYQPLAVNNVLHLVVDIATASRTILSCTSSNATWTVTAAAMVTLNSSNHLGGIIGFTTSTASVTVTITFSGTPGSSPVVGIAEYHSSLGVLGWTYIGFTNNFSATSVTSWPTAALAGGQTQDTFIGNYLTQNAVTGNVNVQGYLTYDQTNILLYGELPSAVTVPATGFSGSSGVFYVNAALVRPTLPVAASGPVPFISGYSGMFYHERFKNAYRIGAGRRSASDRGLRTGAERASCGLRRLDRAGLRWSQRRGGVRVG